jgi:hypothetical protein
MSPVELLKGYPAAIRIYFRIFRRLFPDIATADFPRLGVEQDFLGIKPLAYAGRYSSKRNPTRFARNSDQNGHAQTFPILRETGYLQRRRATLSKSTSA